MEKGERVFPGGKLRIHLFSFGPQSGPYSQLIPFSLYFLIVFLQTRLSLIFIAQEDLLQSFSVQRLPLKPVFASKGNELLDNKRLALTHALFGFQELPYNYTEGGIKLWLWAEIDPLQRQRNLTPRLSQPEPEEEDGNMHRGSKQFGSGLQSP